MPQKIIEIHQLSLRIPQKRLLKVDKMVVLKSNFVAIIGESGGGKSLLCQAILGLLDESICIEGRLKNNSANSDIVLQNIQDNLQDNWTVEKQFHHLLRSYGVRSKVERHEKLENILKRVNFKEPSLILKKKTFELSGGMCQKVAIALALLSEPDLLIVDEPTSALDEESRQMIVDLLVKEQKDHSRTIIFVTHDLNLVKDNATHLAIFKDGQMLEYDEINKVLEHPIHHYTKELIKIFENDYFRAERS